jgi:hypothetical protein
MQRGMLLAVTLGVLLTVVATALAAVGAITPLPAPTFDLKANVSPEKLPAHDLAPVRLQLHGRIVNADGTRPPALREVILDSYKDVTIDGEGLVACRASQLRGRNVQTARQVCGKSIVGTGLAHIGIESSGQLLVVPAKLTLFSSGMKDGTTTLLIHGFVASPRPMPVVASVQIGKAHTGRYGLQAVARFPQIVGGSGSLMDYSFNVNRRFEYKGAKQSYVMARCSDGSLTADFEKVLFEESTDISTAVSTLKGTISAPCTPKD